MWLVARFRSKEIILNKVRTGRSINFLQSYGKFESRHALAICVLGTSKWEKEIDKLSSYIKCTEGIKRLN